MSDLGRLVYVGCHNIEVLYAQKPETATTGTLEQNGGKNIACNLITQVLLQYG